MNAVGIDISKGKSMVAVLRPFGEVVVKPYEFRHTSNELENLANSLRNLDGETRIVMEHTGSYYEPVIRKLHESGLFVTAVNPLLIKEYGGNSIRKVKTDKADAMKIARYGLDNWSDLREHTPMEDIRVQLKTMNRQYSLYSKNKTALKNNLISLLDQTFPDANGYFKSPAREDGSQKWVDFAYTFWHVDCIRMTSQSAFIERYQKWCKRHKYNFDTHKAEQIYIDATEMIPIMPKNNATKILVQMAVNQLKATSTTVEMLRSEMNNLAKQLPEYDIVMGMYGVGSSLGPQIMAEIGDVKRFSVAH